MTGPSLLAATTDGSMGRDILEVVLIGGGAGIGVTVAFAVLLRSFLLSGAARRDGRSGVALAHAIVGSVFAAVCAIAVVGGVLSMLHR